ncbi:UDP-2,3-diacylglucosamine diphosphatase [Geofilum rubicundum]|uniref:UDP-2,3-diacylglucosamine hydrolase n=1 Tax=Geofilum rubicundum JCM 15548 TaxID=1236989 RepID=A0A0E9LTD3_9BACT|nr:UDP-2,3-diacylglucosamine diphosphatase [Geofilum rubicundum]GAO28386.1 UDP-2,3-diacylglucosamine hydrolase [Geofilum rubicundum JCM 15548]
MVPGKKIYFASDVHLGAPTINDHRTHEKRFVNWLNSIQPTASEIYLMGDIFDFWFEYKKAIPKGYSRFLGKLCELTDAGIAVHFFTGNHDIWVFDYLPAETGIQVYRKPLIKEMNGQRFFLAHGDGLTPYEQSYNRLKALFTNKLAQKLFRFIHPDIGIWLATYWSRKSREQNKDKHGVQYQDEEKEWLVLWTKELLKNEHYDYFIFGHRHMAKTIPLNEQSKLIYLGDWITHFSYGEWDGSEFHLKFYKD